MSDAYLEGGTSPYFIVQANNVEYHLQKGYNLPGYQWRLSSTRTDHADALTIKYEGRGCLVAMGTEKGNHLTTVRLWCGDYTVVQFRWGAKLYRCALNCRTAVYFICCKVVCFSLHVIQADSIIAT